MRVLQYVRDGRGLYGEDEMISCCAIVGRLHAETPRRSIVLMRVVNEGAS